MVSCIKSEPYDTDLRPRPGDPGECLRGRVSTAVVDEEDLVWARQVIKHRAKPVNEQREDRCFIEYGYYDAEQFEPPACLSLWTVAK